MYRYEIDETNAIRIYMGDAEVPFLFQPDYPSGEAWTAAQAIAWAEAYVLSVTDPEAPLPGPSSEEPTIARPVVENPEPTV